MNDGPRLEEKEKATEALQKLPELVRGFYQEEYQLIPDTGNFVGLSCKLCRKWHEYGHKENCPVENLKPCLA